MKRPAGALQGHGVTLVSLVAGILLLVGCTATSAPGPTGAPGEEGKPKYGGTLTMPENASTPSNDIDVHRGTASSSPIVVGNTHLPLIGEDVKERGGKIVGYLATSWEASKDGAAYTFKVRELTTHKGKPFNSEDIVYNIERFLKRPNKLALGRSGCWRELVESAQAPDKTTVVVKLKQPSLGFLACVANPHSLFQPKYTLEFIDGPEAKGRPMRVEEVDGVGPFRLTNWIDGSIVEMERSDNYYLEGLPYLEKRVSVELPDEAAIIAAFRTQRLDIFRRFADTPKKSEWEGLTREFGEQILGALVEAPTATGFQLHYKRKPLDDIRLREAIDLAWNRQNNRDAFELSNKISGPYYCGWGWVFNCQELESWPGHRADKTEDLKRAKELMRQAGYDPDKRGSLTLIAGCGTGSPSSCDILQGDLEKIGIDLKIARLEANVLRKQTEDQAFDISTWTRYLTALDPEDYHGLHYAPTAVENRALWENSRFNQLLVAQRAEFDRDKRAKLVREMGQVMYNDHVLLHGYGVVLNQAWWSYVKGYVPPGDKLPHQTTYIDHYIWLDK